MTPHPSDPVPVGDPTVDPETVRRVLAGEVPDVGDTFEYTSGLGSTSPYRVTAWLRRRAPRTPNPDPVVAEILSETEEMLRREGHGRRCAGPDNIPLEFCRRWEAEYALSDGMDERNVRVSDVRVTGRVPWPRDLIDSSRRHGELLAGEPIT
jgi:hypothetical protein